MLNTGHKIKVRQSSQRGFTLIEMLMATVIVIVGLVAVAQLVPTSMMLDSNNRNDGTALVFAQRQMEAMREQPLNAITFTDPFLGNTYSLGDPTQPNVVVGSPVVLYNGAPVIDFSAAPVANYSFTYIDPNDPAGVSTEVRWAVITNVNSAHAVISRRIILGTFRKGMRSLTFPITLDMMVEK